MLWDQRRKERRKEHKYDGQKSRLWWRHLDRSRICSSLEVCRAHKLLSTPPQRCTLAAHTSAPVCSCCCCPGGLKEVESSWADVSDDGDGCCGAAVDDGGAAWVGGA